jgi:hypothetical protein
MVIILDTLLLLRLLLLRMLRPLTVSEAAVSTEP